MSQKDPHSSHLPTPRDVRMRGFQKRTEITEATKLLQTRLTPLPAETVPLPHAAGRVLTHDIRAEIAVPSFARAAMDGYALKGEETFGSSPYNPLDFAIIGQSLPGQPCPVTVQTGQAVRIMTGAPVPAGADTVIQAEATEEIATTDPPHVRVTEAVPPGRHVARPGEDIDIGDTVLHAGRTLRPQDVGVLASLGIAPIRVHRRPTVAILVTGDELLPVGSKPEGYRIVDSNSVMLQALIERDGGQPSPVQMLKDNPDLIRETLTQTLEDVILLSGGSSVGIEDHAPRLVADLGELPIHGVALRPASPTGIGFLQDRPVFLLPGNPVSCLCAYDLFAGYAIRRLGGRSLSLPYPSQSLPLARKISSVVGRVDYARVQVQDGRVEPLAIRGASILSSTTRADGFVLVPADLEGHAPGECVLVYFY